MEPLQPKLAAGEAQARGVAEQLSGRSCGGECAAVIHHIRRGKRPMWQRLGSYYRAYRSEGYGRWDAVKAAWWLLLET